MAGCRYRFDPGSWHLTSVQVDDEWFEEDGRWHCHRPAVDGERHCAFHLGVDGDPPADLSRRLLDELDGEERLQEPLVGAVFRDLDLRYEQVAAPDSYPLALPHLRVNGDVRLGAANVELPLDFAGCVCAGSIDLTDASARREVSFEGAHVAGEVRALDASFGDRFGLSDARIDGGVTARDADFDGRVVCRSIRTKRLDVAGATFGDDVLLDGATIAGAARLSNVTVQGEAFFSGATFGGELNSWSATFADWARFDEVEIRETAMFDDVTFASRTTFDGIACDAARFDGASFEETVSFDRPRPVERAAPLVVQMEDARIADGTLVAGDDALFDLRNATLGSVSLGAAPALSDYRFVNTEFDGFDFAAEGFRTALGEAGWEIHGTTGSEFETPSHGDLESTYLKAKNGASSVGDAKAAGEFFRKELIHRRRYAFELARDGGRAPEARIVDLGRALANWTFGLVAGHGERPWRVVSTSLLVVLGFAALFGTVWPGEIPPYDNELGYLLFSLESFITLVLGGAVPVENTLVRLLAEVEAFVGAFLVALFVFALTRSVHR